ncbi:MAG: 30S ribosomal protein S16 [Bacteroidales bacterium]|nr:30S ribosomal protein S16 [Bacteroidales bacterium]
MPARIRLQRKGKKGKPFYHIVIADGRAPRDGKFIEKIGTYNPLTKPADIKLNVDKAVDWLNKGAQPSDTVKTILSYKGVLYKNHLLKGVKKGAITEEQAEAKFQAWLTEKEAKITGKIKETELAVKDDSKKRLEAEVKINEARAAEIAKKKAKEIAEKAKANEVAEPDEAEAITETKAEETKPEEQIQETSEKVEEVKEEPKTAENIEKKTEKSKEEKTEDKVKEKTEDKVEEKTEEKTEE